MHLYRLLDYCSNELPLAVWQVRFVGAAANCRENAEHRHDCMELMFMTSGTGVCRINGIAYPVLRGDLYVLNPEDVHSYALEPECVFYNILFDPMLFAADPEISGLLAEWSRAGGGPKLFHFAPDEVEPLALLADRLAAELGKRRRGRDLMARSLFGEFLVCLIRRGESAPPMVVSGEQPEIASRVLAYIDRRFCERVTIRELARAAGMSRSAFCTAFRRWTGSSAFEYIGCLRVRKARSLLEDPSLSIGEIALRLGYCDSCHFSRMFRRHAGVSPREYRRTALATFHDR